jgi:hypothetical protein
MSGNYFSYRNSVITLVAFSSPTLTYCVKPLFEYFEYFRIVWWLCIPYLFLDASTDEYEDEAELYEEEEHFDPSN